MQRYFLRFSYIGSRLRGVQRQPDEVFNECYPYTASVQTLFERAFEQFKPENPINVTLSSRTDQGVHAFCNTAHVDLQHNKVDEKYPHEWLLIGLNRYMDKAKSAIRINQIVPVPQTFHCRFSALSRTYLYRLGTRPDKKIPIIEHYRCHFVDGPFDPVKANEAAKLLHGTHDFASFYHGFHRTDKKLPTRRTVSVEFSPGRPLLDPRWDPLYDGLQFWDVKVQARAFLYKQVRRMVGVIISVGQGHMTLQDARSLLDNPGKWNTRATTAHPCGLYLIDIQYDPKDFEEPIADYNESTGTEEKSSESSSCDDQGNDGRR